MALGTIKRLVLRDADYDPKTDSASVHQARTEFGTDDGYEITYSDQHYHVRHSGRLVSFPFTAVRRALREVPEVVVIPKYDAHPAEPPPVVEAPKPVEYAFNDPRNPNFQKNMESMRQSQNASLGNKHQGKRR